MQGEPIRAKTKPQVKGRAKPQVKGRAKANPTAKKVRSGTKTVKVKKGKTSAKKNNGGTGGAG